MDIGLRQSASSVYVDRVMVDALLTAYDGLVLYHLHLARGGDAGGYFPAYADLLGMMLIDGPYLRRPEIRLTYRAATPEGTLEYDFVPSNEGEAVVDAIMATGLEEFAGENLLLVYAAAGREAAYHAAIEQCAGSAVPGSAAMRACLPMRIGEFALRLRE